MLHYGKWSHNSSRKDDTPHEASPTNIKCVKKISRYKHSNSFEWNVSEEEK